MVPYEVFLSYPASAVDDCHHIADAISGWGYAVFFDKTAIQAGSRFPREIDRAIKTVSIGVLVFGHEKIGRRQKDEIEGLCHRNCEEGDERLRLIPYLLVGVAGNRLPYYLKSLENANTLPS